ncbi:MAG: hypothetical protein QOC55_260 [Thermoleophilaceae bacterium]|nr:hypothetical protein [Thermoleophilaceae bacterium]
MKPAGRFMSTALALAVAGTLPAAASAAPQSVKPHHHHARAAGSGAPPVIPSIVRVRIDRGMASLGRAGDYVDRDMPDKAVASLLNARRNMYAAWRGATYVIATAPPPVASAARVHRKAHSSGAAVVGTAYADPNTTAMAVLGYQHSVATAAFGLLDGAKGLLRDAVSTTMFAALNRRDSSIAYIHALPPPDPATADPTTTFDALMPGIIPDLDDELQQVEGLLNGGALTTGEKRIMNQADFQVFRTERTVNTYWPPAAP